MTYNTFDIAGKLTFGSKTRLRPQCWDVVGCDRCLKLCAELEEVRGVADKGTIAGGLFANAQRISDARFWESGESRSAQA